MERVVRHKLTGDRVGTSDGVIVGLSVGESVCVVIEYIEY
jgi:hypothetical protein